MKVMCIDEKEQVNPEMHVIPFGEIVTVDGYSLINTDGWYIKEYPVDKYGMRCSYDKRHFKPLSDKDETELIQQRQTELV